MIHGVHQIDRRGPRRPKRRRAFTRNGGRGCSRGCGRGCGRVREHREPQGTRQSHGGRDADRWGAPHRQRANRLRDLRDRAQVALDVLPGEETLVHDAQGAIGSPLDGPNDG